MSNIGINIPGDFKMLTFDAHQQVFRVVDTIDFGYAGLAHKTFRYFWERGERKKIQKF